MVVSGWEGTDDESAGRAFDKRSESRLEVLGAATFQDNDIPPERKPGRNHVARQLLVRPTYLIANKVADRRRLGHQLAHEIEPLACKLIEKDRHSRYVSDRVAQTVDKAVPHRISAACDDDRDG